MEKIKSNLISKYNKPENSVSDLKFDQLDKTVGDYITYIGKRIDKGVERWDVVYSFADVLISIQEDIQPSRCPLVFFREMKDNNAFYGQSKFKQGLPLQLSLNEIDSAILTHASKQSSPITYIPESSGINLQQFLRTRDTGNVAFKVPSKESVPVHVSLPDLPNDIISIPAMLIERVKESFGVSGIYDGTDSGSLQTSGGVNTLLGRSMLKDNNLILNLEVFLRKLYLLFLEHLKLKKVPIPFSYKADAQLEAKYSAIDFSIQP